MYKAILRSTYEETEKKEVFISRVFPKLEDLLGKMRRWVQVSITVLDTFIMFVR